MAPTRQLVLGSTSRYRHELLERLGLSFDTVAPVCDETPLAGESPHATALRLSVLKARSLERRYPQALIIGWLLIREPIGVYDVSAIVLILMGVVLLRLRLPSRRGRGTT